MIKGACTIICQIARNLRRFSRWRRLREAFGVRGACSRFRPPGVVQSASKLDALQTLRAIRWRLSRSVLFRVPVVIRKRQRTGAVQNLAVIRSLP